MPFNWKFCDGFVILITYVAAGKSYTSAKDTVSLFNELKYYFLSVGAYSFFIYDILKVFMVKWLTRK